MDVEALYDSIKREHVNLAIRHAIEQCRKTWEEDFIEWLLGSINLSLDAAVAKFVGKWYQASGGVATGGKLCVYIANIVVFWAFNDVIYSRKNKHLIYFYRFVDDGTGGWSGTPIQFFRWFCNAYKLLNDKFNLKLTFNVRFCNTFLEFLDVNYRFVNSILDTDVYYKDTDAHRYLSFLSTHPPHTFKSVIYSSFLRLRRIVIDQNLLEFRLNEMYSFLKASDYPDNLLCSIRNDVYSKERDINYRNRVTEKKFDVGWVTTFGPGYGEVKKFISRINTTLGTSPLFSEQERPVLGVVTRRAPNLRDILFSQKSICLDTGRGSVTTRCTPKNSKRVGRPCSSCDLMSEEIKLTIGTQILHCSGGDCKSFNLIYCAQCTRCNKAYIGKTTQPLGKRITQHRNPIATISSSLEIDDTNTLAAHCIEHSTRTKTGFNSLYRFFVIKYVEREKLVISEQFFINKYFTYKPYGLNVSNPIGLTNHFNTNL